MYMFRIIDDTRTMMMTNITINDDEYDDDYNT